jgi:hypothetical protein
VKLISVHFPKAAGTSLHSAYEATFGADRVLRDYAHDPVNPNGDMYADPARYEAEEPITLGEYAVVHGHFHVNRYAWIRDAARVVVLREPVDNLISIYFFWDRMRRNDDGKRGHGIFRYFCEQNLDLVRTAVLPALRYLMTGPYFKGVDMRCFDVIGDFTDVPAYCRQVSECVGVPLAEPERLNVAPESDERSQLYREPETLSTLRDLLAEDLRFYEHHTPR